MPYNMTYNNLISYIETHIGTKKGDIIKFEWDKTNNNFNYDIPANTNGIYIMIDKQSTYNGRNRIVRIGKAFRQKNGLRERLKEHFKGPDNKSILRRLVKSCDKNIDVDNYIRDNIYFVLIAVNNDEEGKKSCKNIEPFLISLCAKEYMNNNFIPNAWLGKKCPKENVRNSKLWNNHHITSQSDLNPDISNMFITHK